MLLSAFGGAGSSFFGGTGAGGGGVGVGGQIEGSMVSTQISCGYGAGGSLDVGTGFKTSSMALIALSSLGLMDSNFSNLC